MAKLHFFPIGNADTTLIQLNDQRLILIDCCNASGEHCVNVHDEIRAYLKKQQRTELDVVAFTHAHGDHVEGAEDFFYFEHAAKYQGVSRIRIKELWVPACFIVDTELCESARVIREEARYRLRQGKGIRVFGQHEVLDSWLLRNGLSPEKCASLITHAGSCVPDFNQYQGQVEFFCHSPFSANMQDQPADLNNNSLVLHLSFFESGRVTRVMLGADAEHDTWANIVRLSEMHSNEDRLNWDLFHISHHCSYTALSPEKGQDETEPREEVKRLFARGGQNSLLISPSKPIPTNDDDLQPPHRQAAAFYRRVARNHGSTSSFIVTMEWPSPEQPHILVVEITANGLMVRQNTAVLTGAVAVTRNPSPRFG